jgi:hypothetical protein
MDPVRVKLTFGHRHIEGPALEETPGSSGRWGRYEFLINEPVPSCEWWVVYEAALPGESTICPPENVIFLTMETPDRQPYSQDFLDQFATVRSARRDIQHRDLRLGLQGQTYHLLGRSYDELVVGPSPVKDRDLSVISSNKAWLEGHRVRLALALGLKAHFGDRADLFGSGIRDFDDKWEVLAPYRYSVAIENVERVDYVTEKLSDCFLAETFPFYAGAPNAADYYPADSFIKIDPRDLEGTIDVIERTLADPNHFERSRPAILEAKRRHLESHSLFPLLVSILDGIEAEGRSGAPCRVTIKPEFSRPPLLLRAAHRLQMLVRKRRQGSYVG